MIPKATIVGNRVRKTLSRIVAPLAGLTLISWGAVALYTTMSRSCAERELEAAQIGAVAEEWFKGRGQIVKANCSLNAPESCYIRFRDREPMSMLCSVNSGCWSD